MRVRAITLSTKDLWGDCLFKRTLVVVNQARAPSNLAEEYMFALWEGPYVRRNLRREGYGAKHIHPKKSSTVCESSRENTMPKTSEIVTNCPFLRGGS